ncbi:hypothetical protein AN478_04605 [Thiohalorhabdus denitrificans]|nr:hypothetical protein [Thiohalorhabdus denitrificans]KPV41179.1 hypothetical protein AN478_04605 [Thiohalorhabdus denitrificans]
MAWTLMDKSGLDTTISYLPDQFHQGIDQASQSSPLPAEAQAAMRKATDEVFAPEVIREEVHARIVDRVSKENMQEVMRFLNTELGRKVVSLEEAAASPEASQKALQQVSTLRRQYRENNPERLQLVDDYIATTRANKFTTDFVVNMQTALTAGMLQALSPEQAPPVDEIRKQIEQNRFQIEGQVGQMLSAQFLYAYRDATNQELRDYLEFLGSPAGEMFGRKLAAILDETMTRRSRTFGQEFGGYLQEAGSESEGSGAESSPREG